MVKLLKKLTAKDWLFAFFVAVLVVIQVWLDLTMPDYTQRLTAAVSSGELVMSEIRLNGAKMLLCALGSMSCAILCGLFSSLIAASFAKILREGLFDHVLDFGNREMHRFTTPSLITRTTNDIVQLQMVVAMGLQIIVKAPILAVWAIYKISSTGKEWTLAVFICVLIMGLTAGSLVLVAYPRFKIIQKLTDKLNKVTRENISGVRVVRAFNAESYQQEKFENVNTDITRNHLFTARILGLMMPIMTTCMSGLSMAIYWIGAYLINAAPVTQRAVLVGEMTAFTQYAIQVVAAFIMLVAIFVILPRVMVSAKRIADVLYSDISITYKDNDAVMTEKGKIEFKDVTFSFNDTGAPCLKNISFTVNPGETFAVIGATGTGKSSLINLIPRFYDVTDGEILIGGVNVKELSRPQLEKTVSLAPQKAVLFMGDIKSNVTYGCKEEISDTDERLLSALKTAKADFVFELSDGIHSHVAQGGSNFSGGQKQRLSIARAVFKGSDIIIFDDTFSALDYKTDMLVRQELKKNLDGTTVIIVAQRIGTIKNADKILVLDNGEAVGIGTHEQLLEACPVYREIALSQLSQEELV